MTDVVTMCAWHLREFAARPPYDGYAEDVGIEPLVGDSTWTPPYGPGETAVAAGTGEYHRGWALDELPDPRTWQVPEPRWSPSPPRKERRAQLVRPRHPRLHRLADRWGYAAFKAAVYVVVGVTLAALWIALRLLLHSLAT